MLRRLGQCLRGTPQILGHLQGFQDLFQYLYTVLPQLTQTATLLSCPEVVTRVSQSCCEQKMGCVVMATSVMQPF